MNSGDMKFGCVIFDDTTLHQTGWKATGEGEATRINFQGTGSLPSDTVWLTNMSYALSSQSGLLQNYRFQQNDYLREELIKMASRHGIQDSREVAEFGAKVFSRSLKATQTILRADCNYVPQYSLKYGFRESLWGKDPCLPLEVARIVDESVSYNCNCERNAFSSFDDDIIGYFKVPARQHSLNILEVVLPFGDFVEIDKKNLPKHGVTREQIAQWILECKMPGFFRITCNNFDEDFNRLINFGVSPSANKRQWICTPELVWLASFADITIHQAVISKEAVQLKEASQLIASIPEIADISLSLGIVFENVWTGLSGRLPDRMCSGNKKSVNPFTPFFRAQDRIALFEKAFAMARLGYDVLGYATGTLRVSIKEKDPLETYAAAQNAGVIPPFLGIDAGILPVPQAPLEYVQWHYATSKLTELLSLDKKIVEKIAGE